MTYQNCYYVYIGVLSNRSYLQVPTFLSCQPDNVLWHFMNFSHIIPPVRRWHLRTFLRRHQSWSAYQPGRCLRADCRLLTVSDTELFLTGSGSCVGKTRRKAKDRYWRKSLSTVNQFPLTIISAYFVVFFGQYLQRFHDWLEIRYFPLSIMTHGRLVSHI